MDYSYLSIADLASEIRKDWKRVSPYAKPYLDAMFSLNSIDDNYIADSGLSIVAYFLSNSASWRGLVAREVKAELKKRIAAYYKQD